MADFRTTILTTAPERRRDEDETMRDAMKRTLARKLCPEVFRDAERWLYAQRQLDDLDKWCSADVPAVGKAARWVLDSVWIHFLPMVDYLRLTTEQHQQRPGPIDEFRRELRRDAGIDEYWPRRVSPQARP